MSLETNKNALFTTMPVGKAVISLAIPTVISQLITVVYNMTDTFFIGQLNDPDQVAAATIAMPVFIFLNAFANLFGIGGSSLISRCLGAGQREKASHCSAFCIWTAAFVSLLYGIAIIFLHPFILPVLGANAGTWNYCSSYIFWTIGIGAVPTVWNAELAHLIRAEGYARQASFGVVFAGVLNMLLDPLFIFAFKMGITGAAIATMLSNVAATVYFFCFIHQIRKYSVITAKPKFYSIEEHIPAEVLAVGLPSFIMSLMSTVSNTVLNHIISSYSNEAVAGMGIAKKIDLIAFAISQGMTQGTLPLIGYNYSSGNRSRMMAAIRTLMYYCVAVAIFGAVALYIAATPITRSFINNEETVNYGRTFLQIICIACPTSALNFLIITIFQATGKKVQPLILSLLRKGGLDVPLMFLFDSLIGINGIAWATPLADGLALIISAALVLPYLRSFKRREV